MTNVELWLIPILGFHGSLVLLVSPYLMFWSLQQERVSLWQSQWVRTHLKSQHIPKQLRSRSMVLENLEVRQVSYSLFFLSVSCFFFFTSFILLYFSTCNVSLFYFCQNFLVFVFTYFFNPKGASSSSPLRIPSWTSWKQCMKDCQVKKKEGEGEEKRKRKTVHDNDNESLRWIVFGCCIACCDLSSHLCLLLFYCLVSCLLYNFLAWLSCVFSLLISHFILIIPSSVGRTFGHISQNKRRKEGPPKQISVSCDFKWVPIVVLIRLCSQEI